MKNFIKVILATALGVFALTSEAAVIVLDDSLSCSAGNAINGIATTDVTGNAGGSTDCWGTFDGNDPGPSGDGFSISGAVFNFVAKDDGAGSGGLSGADIGLSVTGIGSSSTGTWSVDSSKFAPAEFLIVLKAANSPGFAAWLFDGSDAASNAGNWLVAWNVPGPSGNSPDLSHLSVYATDTVVPVPAAVWLFGSGLLGLVGVARRRA